MNNMQVNWIVIVYNRVCRILRLTRRTRTFLLSALYRVLSNGNRLMMQNSLQRRYRNRNMLTYLSQVHSSPKLPPPFSRNWETVHTYNHEHDHCGQCGEILLQCCSVSAGVRLWLCISVTCAWDKIEVPQGQKALFWVLRKKFSELFLTLVTEFWGWIIIILLTVFLFTVDWQQWSWLLL